MALSPAVRRALDELGFTQPTPVQRAAFEPAVAGHDLIVQARTGTGKTLGFGLPLVDRLVAEGRGLQALILAPTRELALQSQRELEQLGKYKHLRTVAVYGGAPMERQIAQLKQGAQIVFGTPGRVLDHIRRGTLDPSGIRVLVLDEADEMFSMGFAKELNAIMDALPDERQFLCFSATIDDDVQRMAERRMHEPEFITLSSDQVGALEISHYVYMVLGDKLSALVRVLEVEDPESAIIFCNTKSETETVARHLSAAGFNADWLNGDLPQREREQIMKRTREGKLRFLVATDVAARGIDISHLTHVINFDFPESAEQYVHRTGRTGRAGRTGTAISVVGPANLGALYYLRLTYKIFPIERSLPSETELKTRKESRPPAAAREAFSEQPARRAPRVVRRLLTHPDAERMLCGLVRSFFAGVVGERRRRAGAARRERPAPVAAKLAAARTSSSSPTSRAKARAAKTPRAATDASASGASAAVARRRQSAPREQAAREQTAAREPAEREPAARERQREPAAREREQSPPPVSVSPPPVSVSPPATAQRSRLRSPRSGGRAAPAAQAVEPLEAPPSARGHDHPVPQRGRRDGLEPHDLRDLLLAASSGLAGDDIGRVRVKERHTFVGVPTRAGRFRDLFARRADDQESTAASGARTDMTRAVALVPVAGLTLAAFARVARSRPPRPPGLAHERWQARGAANRPATGRDRRRRARPASGAAHRPAAPYRAPSRSSPATCAARPGVPKQRHRRPSMRRRGARPGEELGGLLNRPVDCVDLGAAAKAPRAVSTSACPLTCMASGRITRATVTAPGQPAEALPCLEQHELCASRLRARYRAPPSTVRRIELQFEMCGAAAAPPSAAGQPAPPRPLQAIPTGPCRRSPPTRTVGAACSRADLTEQDLAVAAPALVSA